MFHLRHLEVMVRTLKAQILKLFYIDVTPESLSVGVSTLGTFMGSVITFLRGMNKNAMEQKKYSKTLTLRKQTHTVDACKGLTKA